MSTNKEMKLILESWRGFVDKNNNDDLGSIYLFEGKRKNPVEKSFQLVLEDYDNGKISGDQVCDIWLNSMEYEYGLINEGLGDMAKAAGAGISRAWEAAQDWVLQKSVQLYQMAQRGIEGGIKAASALLDKVSDFRQKHPIAFKVASVVALSLAVFALMNALDPSEAMAKIGHPAPGLEGGLGVGPEGQITDGAYEALRGLVAQSGEVEGSNIELRTLAANLIDKAQAASETVDFSEIQTQYGEFADKQLNILNGLAKMAKEGDPEAQEWIDQLYEVGKEAVWKIKDQPTR
jgi:hypothetical protein